VRDDLGEIVVPEHRDLELVAHTNAVFRASLRPGAGEPEKQPSTRLLDPLQRDLVDGEPHAHAGAAAGVRLDGSLRNDGVLEVQTGRQLSGRARNVNHEIAGTGGRDGAGERVEGSRGAQADASASLGLLEPQALHHDRGAFSLGNKGCRDTPSQQNEPQEHCQRDLSQPHSHPASIRKTKRFTV